MKPHSLDKGVVDLLAPRHLDEMDAFYFYRAASNWCRGVGYFKAAAFFAAESQDELEHAAKIEKYLVDWNITVPLPTVPKPQVDFSGLLEVLEEAYKIEYDLYEAYEETSKKLFNMDLCTFDFLQQFRLIQTKSVAEYSDKLNMLEGVKGDKFEMLLLEKKLF
jgi:ferritin